jgi:hypothetical protein
MNDLSSTNREGRMMANGGRRLLVLVAFLGVLASACTPASTAGKATEPPVVVEADQATGTKRLSLSAKAAERLGIATASVTNAPSGGGMSVPYGAVLYDQHGKTWTYTSPSERVYVRAAITIDAIGDGVAILSAGPPIGTAVVTVGSAELWGVESGIGGGH